MPQATVSDPRGLKRICMSCSTRFYDLNKRPVICPNCDTEFTGEVKIRARRGRVASNDLVDDTTEAEDVAETAEAEEEEDEVEEADDTETVSLDEVEVEDADDEDLDIDDDLDDDLDDDDLDDDDDDLDVDMDDDDK